MQMNTEKITPALIRSSRLVFQPGTADESTYIQQQLFALGAIWASDFGQKVSKVPESVSSGLLVDHGTIYFGTDSNVENRLATLAQFEGGYLTPEQKFLKEQFDKVHARLDAMDKKIEALQDAVLPKDLGKAKLGKPAP